MQLNLVPEVIWEAPMLTLVFDNINHVSHHLGLRRVHGVGILIDCGSLQEWLFEGWVILCKVFVEPTFHFSIIVDSYHVGGNIKYSGFIMEFFVGNQRLV